MFEQLTPMYVLLFLNHGVYNLCTTKRCKFDQRYIIKRNLDFIWDFFLQSAMMADLAVDFLATLKVVMRHLGTVF